MEKLLPIEAGCLCIIVHSKYSANIGKKVVALRHSQIQDYNGKPLMWNVEGDELLFGTDLLGVEGKHKRGRTREDWLLRIDGHKPDKFDEDVRERTSATSRRH